MNKQLAMVFPGQGSQTVGMLGDLSDEFTVVEQLFKEASDVLDYDLWQLIQNGPSDQLNQTEYTQPAMLVADVAVFHCWQALGGDLPALLAGHSLGEYSALVCAQSLSFTDAVRLVAKRGHYMQQAVAPGVGAMGAVIGLADEAVFAICQTAAEGQVVAPANLNSIGQIVIAGEKAAVLRALVLAKEKGAKLAKLIPVSVPSHCSLMQPAADALARDLAEVKFNKPNIKILHNVDAEQHEDAVAIRQALIDQMTMPVQWVLMIEKMVAMDVTNIIECGPAKVLTGLTKRITKKATTRATGTLQSLIAAVQSLKESA